jgi:hypothetical protein
MWPWEHLAVGYLCYSLWLHLRHRRRPTGLPVVVLGTAALLPDLIDKPLGWWLGITSSLSVGHSVFFAVTMTLVVWVIGNGRFALPYGIGHLSHLGADVFYKYALGGQIEYEFLLWPLVRKPASEAPGFISEVRYWLANFVEFLKTPAGMAYLGFEITLLGSALILWAYDGLPGLAPASYRRERDLPVES